MKATLERQYLVDAIAAVKGPVDAKSSIPILATVRLAGAEGVMELKSTNLDIASAATLPYEGDDFATCVPLYVLEGAAGTKCADVSMSLADGRLTVTAGSARFQAMVLPADDFPQGFAGEADQRFDIPALALREILRRTAHACEEINAGRFYLTGVHLTIDEKKLTAVATNGIIMCIARCDPGDLKELPADIIVAQKSCEEIIKLCERAEAASTGATVSVSLTQHAISVESGRFRLWSKLIDGTYPEWRRVYGDPGKNGIEFDCAALAGALSRVGLAPPPSDAVNSSNTVRMAVDGDDLTVIVKTAEASLSDRVTIVADGEWPRCFLAHRVLKDLLSSARAGAIERLTLRAGDGTGDPIHFFHKPDGEADGAPLQYSGVMMQIREPGIWQDETE